MGLPESEGSISVKINPGGVPSMVPVRRHEVHWRAYVARGGLVLTLLTPSGALAQQVLPTFRASTHCEQTYGGKDQSDYGKPYWDCLSVGNTLTEPKNTDAKAKTPDDNRPSHPFWASEGFSAWLGRAVNEPISLFTLGLVYFTYRLYRSTEKLWRATKDVFEATERAFVYLEGFNYEISVVDPGDHGTVNALPEEYRMRPSLYITRFAMQPKWKNSGRTASKNMRIQVNWNSPSRSVGPPGTYDLKSAPTHFFVGPEAVEASDVIDIPHAKGIVDHGLMVGGADKTVDFRGPPPVILIWGKATYDDVFGKPHWVDWCHQLRIVATDGKTLRVSTSQFGDYNRTEDT